jgi:hypothetical protein
MAKRKEENTEEEKYKKYEKYYEALRPLAKVLSGYGGYGLRIDPLAPSFAFDHEREEIIISPRLVESLNLKEEEGKYIFCHELAHMIQLFQSPENYLEAFNIPKEKAKREKEKEPIINAWRNFFNAFFDIHANSIVRAEMPIYQKGEELELLPQQLYATKAFPEKDYSKAPLTLQFLNYLLRRTMVPNEEVKIDDEVKKEIEKGINYFGEKYRSLEEFVKKEIFNPSKTIKEIMFDLKEFLMPVYEKLLQKDKQEGKLKEIPATLYVLSDTDLSEEDVKKIIEGIKNVDPNKKYQKSMEKYFKEWAKGKGISEEYIRKVLEIKKETAKVTEDLEELWRNFVQKSIEYEAGKHGFFKSGSSISIEETIRQLPTLLTQPSETKIFTKYLPIEKRETIKPRKINVELVVDLSGSMDEEKRDAVQKVAYAIGKSLINFYRTGNLSFADQGAEFPVSINYRILGFGSSVEELTETTEEEKKTRIKKDRPEKDLDEELIKAISKIEAIDLGGTNDALALNKIKNEITPEIKKRLENGDEILIILEITDGETATETETKSLVKEFNKMKNVYCRAIQIPGPVFSEEKKEARKPEEYELHKKILPPTGTFKEVWGDEWGKRLEDLEILKDTIVAILYDALRKKVEE